MNLQYIKPLKKFGQNYLVDKNIAEKILNEFDPKPDDLVLEIGPGKGALTQHLVKKLKKLYAVEIDNRVIENLKNDYDNIEVINVDFLKLDLAGFCSEKDKVRVIGNIPYNLTSSIIFKLIEQRELVEDVVLMVQYEVAKRISAKPNIKDYGILSVLLNFFAETKYCFKVSSNVFRPKPKVDSAIIHIYFNKELPADISSPLFIQTVKAAFGNRRKILKNSFSNSAFGDIDFSGSGINLTRRAETLTTDEFISLTRFISEIKK